MRFLLGLFLLFVFGAAAAKPSPFERHAAAAPVDDGAIYLGSAGALLESDYFNVPRAPAGATRVFPCRFDLHATRARTVVAQSCD